MVAKKKHSEFWRMGAAEDWEVAEKLLKDKKVRHGLFFAHLALEKKIKALISLRTDDLVPRIHNLVRLAELAGLDIEEKQQNLLADMNQFNIEGRYPEMLSAAPSLIEATEYFERAGEVMEWLNLQF